MKLVNLIEASEEEMQRMRDMMDRPPIKGTEDPEKDLKFRDNPRHTDPAGQQAGKLEQFNNELTTMSLKDRNTEQKNGLKQGTFNKHRNAWILELVSKAAKTRKDDFNTRETKPGEGGKVGVLRGPEDRLINKAQEDVANMQFSNDLESAIDYNFWLSPRSKDETVPALFTLWRHVN